MTMTTLGFAARHSTDRAESNSNATHADQMSHRMRFDMWITFDARCPRENEAAPSSSTLHFSGSGMTPLLLPRRFPSSAMRLFVSLGGDVHDPALSPDIAGGPRPARMFQRRLQSASQVAERRSFGRLLLRASSQRLSPRSSIFDRTRSVTPKQQSSLLVPVR